MNEKINIAELLKDCPKGMELDCTCADNVVFDKIIEYDQIKCVIGKSRDPFILDKYGRLLYVCCPKCVIFPKGKTTWKGFQIPFKDGDVVVCEDGKKIIQMFILKSQINNNKGYCYTGYDFKCNDFFNEGNWYFDRLATEEEKQKLFDAIKANGYRWNDETKTLEKLIEPKFKVGDRIRNKKYPLETYFIVDIYDTKYDVGKPLFIDFKSQDYWELIPNKFDITTLKPFDKVLVRDSKDDYWNIGFFSFQGDKHFCTARGYYAQCIPYEENKHLLGTTNDCDEYYKTWE